MKELSMELNIEFVKASRELLNNILNDPNYLKWCKQYSCYGIERDEVPFYKNKTLGYSVTAFIENAYKNNMVPCDYAETVNTVDPEGTHRENADLEWVRTLNVQQVVGCIGWHFRRDHFENGALINLSMADGSLFRLFDRLVEIIDQEG